MRFARTGVVIASVSEAIQKASQRISLDCFVACAPRNDAFLSSCAGSTRASILQRRPCSRWMAGPPRRQRVLRPRRRVKPSHEALDSAHSFTFSRRHTPEPCQVLTPGRAQGMPDAWPAPAASRARIESTRVSHHRSARTVRHSLRDGATVSFVLSPVIGLSCHRRRRDCRSNRRQLNASVEASRPHDFAVRYHVARPAAQLTAIASRTPRS